MKIYNKTWIIALLLVGFFIILTGCDPSESTEPKVEPTATPTAGPTAVATAEPTPEPPQLPVELGSAGDFAILASETITNTGDTTIYGDIALSPGTGIVGFPPGNVFGNIHINDVAAIAAKVDLATALANALALPGATEIGTELGGSTLSYGLYDSAAGDFGITGTLTLDGADDPNAIFIFQAASTLVTAEGSNIVLTNGAQAKNVFWYVHSSATLGVNSNFIGTIMAQASITLTTGAEIFGKLLAHDGAVTLDANTIAVTP